ncbi:methyltransferase domain-containing protein [Methanofollis formosanus]|uniref:Methyltransferase domain-containing protein n=1 Tax=Methanofollis formosanus TaxID=299308 RepID=A0A8G1EFD2_9EURY|nr:methyltransferase domain-containing protein [Methanofollis formosanus]QYZ78673.1 methyltransferase domain-containing protein [Methanofollis formosanus]
MKENLEKVQEHYDHVAEVYDSRYGGDVGERYHGHIREQVMCCLPKGGDLLDIGCGTGLFMNYYLSHGGGRAVGLDLSPAMLREGRSRNRLDHLITGTADYLPFRDNSFDAVSSILAFSYVQDPAAMLDEVYRVLRPGGRVAICTLGHNLFTAALPAVYKIGEKVHWGRVGVGDFDEHYYSDEEICALFTAAGFTGVETRRCSFAHVNLAKPIFEFTRRFEPFVERRVPYLAFNLCASGKKEE